jgi:CheY-like chemotaxis protein
LIYAPTDITRLLSVCFDSVRPKLEEKKLVWKIEAPKNITTMADEARLQQVINNIIGNAIKFTPVQGRIIAHVDQALDSAGHPWLTIAISDTGRGIPTDKIESIFDKYQQAQSADRESGSGLGLAICKNIALLHGGDIKVKSVMGQGSTFTISIPLRTAVAKDEGHIEILKNKKILVVDDSNDVLHLMQTKLSQRGARVKIANNGAKALEEIEREKPDIVMLDLEMPVLNGIDTLKQIREKYNRHELPVIIFSNKAQTETIEFFQMDVNDFANKREMIGEVFEKMAKVLEAKVIQESKEARVLLVDDSEDIQALFQLFLKDQPMVLDFAPTLKHAKHKIQNDGPYDLIFLDMNLPDGSGMDLVAPLRAWEKAQGVREAPLIAITGMAGKEVDPRLLETSGIKIVISKSITKQKLLAYINQYIDQQKLKMDS